MLKFKGKPWQFKQFICDLKSNFGEKATIKEICERIGRNVYL
jgi:hypothetical protein